MVNLPRNEGSESYFLIISIYLPPEIVSFIDPRSTMYFLAEEPHDEDKCVFCQRSTATRAKMEYLAEECIDEAKKYRDKKFLKVQKI